MTGHPDKNPVYIDVRQHVLLVPTSRFVSHWVHKVIVRRAAGISGHYSG